MDKTWNKWRGWHKGKRWYRREIAAEHYVLDPDFDEDDTSCIISLWRDEIEKHGCIMLHPDGDSRDPMFDPVPLCSHVPDGDHESCEFMSKTLYLKRRTREIREQRAETARIAAQVEARRKELAKAPQPTTHERMRPPPWQPPPSEPNEVETPMGEMLRNMRIKDPVVARLGRVWRNYVMINEADKNHDTIKRSWPEVWRGHGMVIFRMESEYEVKVL